MLDDNFSLFGKKFDHKNSKGKRKNIFEDKDRETLKRRAGLELKES